MALPPHASGSSQEDDAASRPSTDETDPSGASADRPPSTAPHDPDATGSGEGGNGRDARPNAGDSPNAGDGPTATDPSNDPPGAASPDAPDGGDGEPGASENGPNAEAAKTGETAADPGDAPDDRHTTLGEVQEPQRLHPLTMLLRVLASLPALLLLLLPTLQNPSSQNFFSLGMMVLYGVLALPAIVLQYLRFSYRITPKQIVIQQGVFNRQNRSIPIERVQNIQIERNLLARLTRIAKVKIETAGSSGTEGTLEYVGYEQAQEIRRLIRSIQREQAAEAETPDDASAEAGAEAPDRTPAAQTLYTMSLPRVLQSGAFRFSLLYIALVFSILQFIEPDVLLNWLLVSRGEIEGLTETAFRHPGLAVAGTVVVATVLGWVSGILVHLNRYYGFQLWLEDGKLRKRHGLFTVSEGTIPLEKVQTLILKTNPVMRAFGFFELEVQTIGLNVNEQGHRVIAPFATRERILELARQVRSFDLPATFQSVSPLTIRRTFVRYTTALTVAVTVGAYFWPSDWVHPFDVALPWWGFALVPFIAVYAYFEYRNHGYNVQEDGFYVRRGVFSHYVWIIPTEKFHVFYTASTLFQQRLGLQTLFVDTAGAASFAYPEVVDLPAKESSNRLATLHDHFATLYRDRIEAATGDAGARLSADERPHLPDTIQSSERTDA
jgi:putative membrane protein